ncbi:23S rRNA (cytidine(2498)-2'-O)-methyltransferase RlmM [Xanthomonas campestris pv. campestris]|uniref:23S rRNA (cytidine(2498)-2'-O)-methyltransferase RlmM n=1 Tax=Xanthomonas campestris TaxID=339 RepID=UPI00237884C4|nr:23S rRNA (cytidine(2498)-2'-O)-methyltransferase RlmM [Xanthomonas campestris]WDK57419.1 23S rRNA (cytidine(2498)-2'-O)-methyltransferase RlmM [Xanthomonas campestris pv. campestris]WDK63672.1 23S rRNA (cytidine(2498)-2'-O)-methyltransferase RlmM [Xanthomonas campestris pv. campestris]WDK67717.1 23S rRNA (cytidine(2498)-2'-O)-methyltransferase RlmM [Xanthomonas campestris pv. campestris]WDK71593.1 23S rRNA (cytidine(2498)-2'-O)-methyltransferase RlmM [Xanthomonas campestris pv. campestris]W
MSGLLCYCRQGFEPELAAELSARAAFVGIAGYARTQRNDGYVLFVCDEAAQLAARLQWRELIFARQKLVVLAELKGLDPKDRITPILAALDGQPRFGDLWVEHPDSDAGKPLAGLARSFGNALRPALRKAGLLTDKPQARLPRLHICFLDGDHALLAVADSSDSAPWPLGIPRLKLLPEAPSRSALKLDEALLTLLTPEEREQLVKPGMRAADLGAAPGGWTWVLSRQHVHVTSVDNGPLREHVLATGLVEHLRADGFHWKPAQPLDWMVCDMVEQPRRVAERMATWVREGWCRHTIFNLKLPMKKRWDETRLCLDLFEQQAEKSLTVRAKQLYHDREEITVLAMRG